VSFELRFRPEVLSDVAEAFSWYEGQVSGLGDEFLREYFRALHFLRDSAEAPRRVFEDFRRILLKRFPFAVWYEVEANAAIILLVWDCRRDPERLSGLLRSRS
jgi:hypothetical protein